MRDTLWRALIGLIAVSLLAAACGDGEDDTTADDAVEAATETADSDDEASATEPTEDAGDDDGAMEDPLADGNITIGFSVQSISRTFFSGMLAGIEGAESELEDKYGVNITILTTTAQDEASIQDENTSDLIAAGVDGVLFSPVNSGAATEMVDRLIEAEIPVVAVANQIGDVDSFGRNTIYPGTVGYVTNDDIAMGAKAAEAADVLAAELDGPADIFILQGTNGAANVPLRQGGFEERLGELGTDWNLLDARPGDFSNVVAEDTCQNAITAYPEMDIIYSMSDEMTAGCVRALESADRLDIGIASIGGNAKGIGLLEDGLMPATVCQKPGTMGATALDVLLDFIVNGNEQGLVFYETPVVTLDNLEDCVPQW
ncbi:MAG: sugar ABC transporter substrate-binding protein [Actinomycetota bacterium]